jgi:hypothetical protein
MRLNSKQAQDVSNGFGNSAKLTRKAIRERERERERETGGLLISSKQKSKLS